MYQIIQEQGSSCVCEKFAYIGGSSPFNKTGMSTIWMTAFSQKEINYKNYVHAKTCTLIVNLKNIGEWNRNISKGKHKILSFQKCWTPLNSQI